jgi:hypothetical protein
MKIFSKLSLALLMLTAILGLASLTKAAMPTVDLGTAGNFAILSGTPNITNTGATKVIGNVGLSPAGGAGIGLLSSQVTGTIYAIDAFGPAGSVNDPGLLTTAQNDLTAAYNSAAGRTPVTTVATELGGQTLTSGVYTSDSTALQITAGAGDLVLNGQGDPNAVFIFEASDESAEALTVGPGSTISLINGAQACNVFWRVYGASINTTAVFKGNLMALTSITVANGANIEGRLLARNGSVTLINDTVTAATCAATSGTTTTTTTTTVPKLPNTGVNRDNTWDILLVAGMLVGSLLLALAIEKYESKKIS